MAAAAAIATYAATALPLHFETPNQLRLQFQCHFQFQFRHLCHPVSSSFASPAINLNSYQPILGSYWSWRRNGKGLMHCSCAAVVGPTKGTSDPDLRSVLELATDSELYELEGILFGQSYFSPLLKSMTKQAEVDYFMIQEDPKERDDFIAILESRFLFLAADARSTLRGWRPTYRNVLLGVREKLKVPCSRKLSTEDLEAEIFLYLLQEYSSESETFSSSRESFEIPSNHGNLEHGLSQWKVQAIAALKVGAAELHKMILKGGGMFTLGQVYRLVARKLLGKVFSEAANYRIKNEVLRKGGQLAAVNLESRMALLAAKKGVTGAAARYMGLRSMMGLLGPLLWGTLLADVVIQMLGTDYARILRAIYAFAQIRITRTYRLSSDVNRRE